MGVVTYLEDPPPGDTAESIMVKEDIISSLKMWCRGSTNCCGKEATHLCVEGEGDCDHDDQCAGVLQCGQDNCATQSGGYWDPEDDCCERRCSTDRPCPQVLIKNTILFL